MVAERIKDPAESPAVLDADRADLVAPAATARSTAASGSATTSSIRVVLPPSDSGLKLRCAGDSSATQKDAVPIAS